MQVEASKWEEMYKKSKLMKMCLLLMALAILPPGVRAEALPGDEVSPPLSRKISVDRIQSAIGNGARGLADKLDRFFSDEQIEEELQTTRVRLKPTIIWSEGGQLETLLPLRIDLALPRLENKWKIFVKSFQDDDDDEIPNELDPKDDNGVDKEDDTSTFFGLQYTILSRTARHIKLSAGPKLRSNSLRFFGDARIRFQYLTGTWITRLTQQVFFNGEEFGERTRLDFQQPIGKKNVFRSASMVMWSETSQGVDLKQTFLLRHFLSESKAAGASCEITGHTRPYLSVDTYVAALEYRQKMWRDWLYLNIKPQAKFPHETDFRFTPLLNVSLEAIF